MGELGSPATNSLGTELPVQKQRVVLELAWKSQQSFRAFLRADRKQSVRS
jgi:hypothetical protein